MALALAAGMSLTGCKEDTEPRLEKPTAFVLDTPATADQTITLTADNAIDLTVSQPNYGVLVAPYYQTQVSFTEDFAKYEAIPTLSQKTAISLSGEEVALAMCTLMGYVDNETSSLYSPDARKVYFRVHAYLDNCDYSDITSNVVSMTLVPYKAVKQTFLYTPGESNGWNQGASQMLSFNSDKQEYQGFAHLKGEFKFSAQPSWDGINYGKGDKDGTLSTKGDAVNLSVDKDGLYWVTVNVNDLKYTATLITSLGVIGGMNDWGAQEALTPSEDFLTWTGNVTFSAGDEWKFRMNDDWGINLGGAQDKLELDGSNLTAPGAGAFTVTLDLTKIPYSYKAAQE